MKSLSLVLVLLAGCGGADASAPAAAPAKTAAAVDPKVPDPACLAHADEADGAADHVVHKCANCGLAMDGKAEFTSQIEGYELHSCSDSCKGMLEKNPGTVLARSCKKK
jgi:hypothetical protein